MSHISVESKIGVLETCYVFIIRVTVVKDELVVGIHQSFLLFLLVCKETGMWHHHLNSLPSSSCIPHSCLTWRIVLCFYWLHLC